MNKFSQAKRILVLGSKGMLGYAISEYFTRKLYKATRLTRDDFDAAKDSVDYLNPVIEENDVVINCIGVTKPRLSSLTVTDLFKVNSIFPHNLAKLCRRLEKPCFHITTDCVFSGRKGNYTEDDYYDENDLYGISKAAGDTSNCMTLRTSIIGEEKGQSRFLLEWARSQAGKEVNGFTNHYWNGVTTVYLAEIIERILQDDLYKNGVFHIHSPNAINKLELLKFLNNSYDLKLKVNPTNTSLACNRSLSSKYSLSKKLCVKQIDEQIEAMQLFFSENRRIGELSGVKNAEYHYRWSSHKQ